MVDLVSTKGGAEGSPIILTGSHWPTQNLKTSFEKNCFSAWASTLNMGLINKVCLSPVGYGV